MQSKEELSTDQSTMLGVVYFAFTRTVYPWLIAANVKKISTLMKKLVLLYQSDRAWNELLATDNA